MLKIYIFKEYVMQLKQLIVQKKLVRMHVIRVWVEIWKIVKQAPYVAVVLALSLSIKVSSILFLFF